VSKQFTVPHHVESSPQSVTEIRAGLNSTGTLGERSGGKRRVSAG
jgi:hypothetical protein